MNPLAASRSKVQILFTLLRATKIRAFVPTAFRFTWLGLGGGRHQAADPRRLRARRHVGFRVAGYATSRALVIDPVLVYSTNRRKSDLEIARVKSAPQ